MTDLGEYLKASVAKRWKPGVFDCCFFPGEWAVQWGCGDPMAEWRGQYTTDMGGLRFIQRAGGLLNLWQRGLESIGIYGVNDPLMGDVGVVRMLNEAGIVEPVGAIYTGSKWAVCAPVGLLFTPAEVLRCWGPRHG